MTISKTHQRFASGYKKPDAIEHPEKYLGPNWESVLNFWEQIDKLSDEQIEIVKDRFSDAYNNSWVEWRTAFDTAWTSSNDVVGFKVSYSIWGDATRYGAEAYATLELIGMHKLIEHGKQPYFIPMFDNL